MREIIYTLSFLIASTFTVCAEISAAVISECIKQGGDRTYALNEIIIAENQEIAERAAKLVMSWGLGDKYLVVICRTKDGFNSRVLQLKIIDNACTYNGKQYRMNDENELAELLRELDSFKEN